MSDSLSFGARFGLAWACFFKILFDGRYAQRVSAAALPLPPPAPAPEPPVRTAPAPTPPAPAPSASTDALQLLALLQREGRLIDFLEQDIAPFSDADVASAARVVHDGCRKALHARAELAPVRSDDEGAKVTLAVGFSAAENRLVGDVRGEPPYTGTLRHRGWRVKKLSLPTAVAGHDASIIAPAEIDL